MSTIISTLAYKTHSSPDINRHQQRRQRTVDRLTMSTCQLETAHYSSTNIMFTVLDWLNLGYSQLCRILVDAHGAICALVDVLETTHYSSTDYMFI